MRSRVMPGSSPTIERRDSVSRLKSVDLPTLGRPTMAKVGAGCPVADGLAASTRYVRWGLCLDFFNVLADLTGIGSSLNGKRRGFQISGPGEGHSSFYRAGRFRTAGQMH